MANVKVRSGIVRNAVGAVLTSKPAQLINATTGATIGAPVNTDVNGRYTFSGLDETVRYSVSVAFGGGSNQVHVNSPISPDLDDAYVNTSLRSAPGAVVAFGGPVSVGGTITATNAPLVSRSTSNARVMLVDTDAAANEKAWGINNQDGDVGIQPWNDAENAASGDGLFLIRGTGMAIANAGLTIGGVQRIFANTNGVVLAGANTVTGTLGVTGALTAGSELLVSNGTLAAPSVAFTNDPNTGVYRVAEGTLALVTNGVARLTATPTGVTLVGDLRTDVIADSAALSGGIYGRINIVNASGGTLYYIPVYRV